MLARCLQEAYIALTSDLQRAVFPAHERQVAIDLPVDMETLGIENDTKGRCTE